MFDPIGGGAIVELARGDARAALAQHKMAAIAPVPADLLPILWWALLPDPGARMPTLRGPPIHFGPGLLWRRTVLIWPSFLVSAQRRIHFEQRMRSLPSPDRLARWYGRVAEFHRRAPPRPMLAAAE